MGARRFWFFLTFPFKEQREANVGSCSHYKSHAYWPIGRVVPPSWPVFLLAVLFRPPLLWHYENNQLLWGWLGMDHLFHLHHNVIWAVNMAWINRPWFCNGYWLGRCGDSDTPPTTKLCLRHGILSCVFASVGFRSRDVAAGKISHPKKPLYILQVEQPNQLDHTCAGLLRWYFSWEAKGIANWVEHLHLIGHMELQ